MQLQWRRVTGIYVDGRTAVVYIYGPCMMIEYRHGESNQTKRKYLFEGKSFKTEDLLVKYVDSKVSG